MPTATLTVNWPSEEIEFLQKHSQQHGLTAAEVVARYLHHLKSGAQPAIHPEVAEAAEEVGQQCKAPQFQDRPRHEQEIFRDDPKPLSPIAACNHLRPSVILCYELSDR